MILRSGSCWPGTAATFPISHSSRRAKRGNDHASPKYLCSPEENANGRRYENGRNASRISFREILTKLAERPADYKVTESSGREFLRPLALVINYTPLAPREMNGATASLSRDDFFFKRVENKEGAYAAT